MVMGLKIGHNHQSTNFTNNLRGDIHEIDPQIKILKSRILCGGHIDASQWNSTSVILHMHIYQNTYSLDDTYIARM